MFCVECGQKMDDGAKFCSNCGKPLNRDGNVSGERAGAAGAASAEKTQAPSSIMLPDIPGETMKASSAAISSDGKCLAVIDRDKGALRTIDTRSGETLRSMIREESSDETLLAVSPDGGFVVINDEDTWMVNVQTGEQIELGVENHDGNRFCFSHDSKRLAYARGDSSDERLTIIAVPKGDKVLSIDLPKAGFAGYIDSIAFSPDRKFIAAGLRSGYTNLWDVRNGNEIFAQDTEGTLVAFSPDGSRIAVAGNPTSGLFPVLNFTGNSKGYSVCLLDAKSGDVLLKFEVPAMRPVKIRFSPDGSAIVVCENDGAIRIINAETGEVLRQLHADCLEWASYTPDGKQFISFSGYSDEECVKYWVSE
jgi:WD40 repeat protein